MSATQATRRIRASILASLVLLTGCSGPSTSPEPFTYARSSGLSDLALTVRLPSTLASSDTRHAAALPFPQPIGGLRVIIGNPVEVDRVIEVTSVSGEVQEVRISNVQPELAKPVQIIALNLDLQPRADLSPAMLNLDFFPRQLTSNEVLLGLAGGVVGPIVEADPLLPPPGGGGPEVCIYTDDFEAGSTPRLLDSATYASYASSGAVHPVVRDTIGVSGTRGLDLSAGAVPRFTYAHTTQDFMVAPGPISVSAALFVDTTVPAQARAQVGFHEAPHQREQGTDTGAPGATFGEIAAIAVTNNVPGGTRLIQFIHNDLVVATRPFSSPGNDYHVYRINYFPGVRIDYLVDNLVIFTQAPIGPVQGLSREAVTFVATLRGLGAGAAADNLQVCGTTALVGPGDLAYGAETAFMTGNGPARLHAADLDGDGDLDLATANTADNSITTLLNDGSGGFVAGATVLGVGPVYDMEVGDFDRNGFPDLVACTPMQIQTFLSDGVGGLMPGLITLQDSTAGIELTDFTLDGQLDLAVGNNSRIFFYVPDGMGGFVDSMGIPPVLPGNIVEMTLKAGSFDRVPRIVTLTDEAPRNVIINQFDPNNNNFFVVQTIPAGGSTTVISRDLDGNFHEDFLTFDPIGKTFRFTFETGAATLADNLYATNIGGAVRLAVADVDRDGLPDLLATESSTGAPQIVINLTRERRLSRGDAYHGVRESLRFPIGSNARDLLVADLDRNGILDLATISALSNRVTIRLGSVTPNKEEGILTQVMSVAAGGTPDVIEAAELEFDALTGFEDAVFTLAGAPFRVRKASFPRGVFEDFTTTQNSGALKDIDVGDLDLNGVPDLVIADTPQSGKIIYPDPNNFSASVEGSTSEPAGSQTLFDFDRDAFLDLVGTDGNQLYMLPADRIGAFSARIPLATAGGPGLFVQVDHLDFDRDGNEDIVVVRQQPPNSFVDYYRSSGDGTFVLAYSSGINAGPTSLAVADLDRDGKTDVAVTSSSASSIQVLLNTHPAAPVASPVALAAPAFDLEIEDMTGDGILDLVAMTRVPDAVAIRVGNGAGGFTAGSEVAVAPTPQDMIPFDVDGNGTTDVGVISSPSNRFELLSSSRVSTSLEGKGP